MNNSLIKTHGVIVSLEGYMGYLPVCITAEVEPLRELLAKVKRSLTPFHFTFSDGVAFLPAPREAEPITIHKTY